MKRTPIIPLLAAIVICYPGCSDGPSSVQTADHDATPPPSNRISVPEAVRQNLGITFARVESRPVRQTLRLPGEFELRPDARREYRTMIAGRVSLKVKQFEAVTPSTLLFTIDSPQWRDIQHETVESASRIKLAQGSLEVAIAQQREIQQAADFIKQRIVSLEDAQMRNVQLEADKAQLDNQLPRLAAEIEAKQVELSEANAHFRSRLRTLASITGLTVETLLETSSDQPRWVTLDELPTFAGIAGVVSAIDVTDGGWLETGGLVMAAADPAAIRFRAHALQSDMARLKNGQSTLIVPPQGGSLSLSESIGATLSLGFEGSPDERTIPIYATPTQTATWSRPGVSAFLEVFTNGEAQPELAIPNSALVRDGLTSVVFRRDPSNPDQVIRMEADLGATDGRWTVVKSGMKAGDEVVLDGAYQLMLASSGSAQKGGHFHADGTFHEGEDE